MTVGAGFVLAVVTLLIIGCGGKSERPAGSFTRVHFSASDGVRLDGLYGSGSVGVILVHMGRGGDDQTEWSGVARDLAGRGYLVLTYDRRGVCPGGPAGCSQGVDDYATSWRDIVGAARFIRRQGADKTAVAGASIGAMASLFAASRGQIHSAAIVEFAGINHASGYDFRRADVHRVAGAKLLLSSRHDIYGGAEAARQWYGWASPPKRLELVAGSDHGTDLLQPDNVLRGRVQRLIVTFLEEAAPP
jgi:pimeloyl-ACP methyl ester carboxylesterase